MCIYFCVWMQRMPVKDPSSINNASVLCIEKYQKTKHSKKCIALLWWINAIDKLLGGGGGGVPCQQHYYFPPF